MAEKNRSQHPDAPGLMDGIRIAKDNERAASEFYARAASTAGNSWTRKLFEQLTEFEQIHYDRLTDLENSLRNKGAFVEYAGTEFVVPPQMVVRLPEVPDKSSLMKIINEAVDLETRAESAYNKLADITTDKVGHDMFSTLAEEEHNHFVLLKDVYWTLNNLGEWSGPRR
jgi:rubrerythrin